MRKRDDKAGGLFASSVTRRTALKGAVSGAAILSVPVFLTGRAHAAGEYMDLDSLRGAKKRWVPGDVELGHQLFDRWERVARNPAFLGDPAPHEIG